MSLDDVDVFQNDYVMSNNFDYNVERLEGV